MHLQRFIRGIMVLFLYANSSSVFADCSMTVFAKIGSPVNGTNHCIDISWTPVAGAISYRLSCSSNNIVWQDLYTGNALSYHHICGDKPNAAFYYMVSATTDGSDYCTPVNCNQFPIYTACDAPVLSVFNPKSHTVDITLLQETPLSNPDYTQYSIYCKTNSRFVQENGTLGLSEVFRTKIQWGKIIVTGLDTLTQYCFYAKVKNAQGDIRYNLTDKILSATQGFNDKSSISTYDCSSYIDHSKWNLCQSSSPPWIYSDTAGCTDGGIKYYNHGNSFVYSPYFDISGMQGVVVSFNLSNSYNPSYSQNAFWMLLSNDVNSTPFSSVYFDRVRNCEYNELFFDVKSFTVNPDQWKSIITSHTVGLSPDYIVKLDNISIKGQVISLSCVSTRKECIVPKIAINEKNQLRCTGDSLTFSTNSSGTDTLFYQWKKNNVAIQGATLSSLTFNSLTLADEGYYSCYISNFCGNNNSGEVILTVNSPMTVKISPDNPVKCVGDSITFRLKFTGTSPLSFSWKKGNNVIANASSDVYTIMKISGTNEDLYTCIASNACGTDSSRTILTVSSLASINIIPLIITKNLGDSLKLSISPYGTPPFSFEWLRNDTVMPGVTNDSLNLSPVRKADEGIYFCKIANICGTTNKKICTLIVNNGSLYTVQGSVLYDDKTNSALKSSSIYLYLKSDSLVLKDSASTDSLGNYKFQKVSAGVYAIRIIPQLPWGGVNPTDALHINRYYIRLYTFKDELMKRTADVNIDNKINPFDALLINRRYIKLVKKFPLSDWIFDNEDFIVNSDTTFNIKAICAGDVNGSY